MLEGYARNNNYARFDTHSYHSCRETEFNARVDVKLRQSHRSMTCRSRALGMLKGYVNDNYYARFDTCSSHSCREKDLNARVDVKLWQSHWRVKCRSREPGHSACLKGMLWATTMQGLTLTAIIAAEKQTLMLGLT